MSKATKTTKTNATMSAQSAVESILHDGPNAKELDEEVIDWTTEKFVERYGENALILLGGWQKGYNGSSVTQKRYVPSCELHLRKLIVQRSDNRGALCFVTAGFANPEHYVTAAGEDRTAIQWDFLAIRRFSTSDTGIAEASDWIERLSRLIDEVAATAAFGWGEVPSVSALVNAPEDVFGDDDE